jgi:rhodanese-related sulfurtransferase
MAPKHSPGFLRVVDEARRHIRECTIHDVKARMDRGEPLLLIDVREESEFAADRIVGAVHLGKGVLERDVEERFPDPSQELILYCGGGFRSALAARSLGLMGYTRVVSMDGGIRAWREALYPLAR